MTIFSGTSGYSYKEWKGSFYPEKIAAAEMLAFYATRLPAVEINNTFYRLPKTSVLEAWAGQVPPGFRFSIKASRRITHLKRLKDAADETAYLLETVAALGERLGAILFQLPPNLRLDLPRLEGFLELLPPDTRAVFEFRHPSWSDPAVRDLLASRGFALCVADTDDAPASEIPVTASWAYLRLRRPGYSESDLKAWVKRLEGAGLREAFVFFKHEGEGVGPRLAARFLELAGGAGSRVR
jgi:uncharacterized protein YecE (DUF72 family)